MADEMTYYELLGINQDSTEKEITKAYRKKALQCHPDKNPDNPNAVDLFHKLSKAFEVLGNPKAKAAYDAKLKAKERARLRTQAYDSKRKKFKEDLEQREKSCQDEVVKDEVLVKNLEQEIERLREEGLKILQREQEVIKQKIEEERKRRKANIKVEKDAIQTPKLKIRWKSQKNDASNGGYSSELLNSMFQKYGEIENLLVSSRKGGSAIIEFKDYRAAKMAVENERGNPGNPLKISWLEGCSLNSEEHHRCTALSEASRNMSVAQENLITEHDFESLVMRKLRQAEERKRLCEQLANEDG